MKSKKWDAGWKKLRLETKLDRIKERLDFLNDHINYCYADSCAKARSASASAGTALYVANLNR